VTVSKRVDSTRSSSLIATLSPMAQLVDPEDLIDSRGVAEVLGLSHINSVSLYQRRYPDMPRPIVDLGPGRARLWLRSEVQLWWARQRGTKS